MSIPNAQTPPSPDPSKPWGSARTETPDEDQAVAHGQPQQSARDGLVEHVEKVLQRAKDHGITEGLWLFASQWQIVLDALRTAQPNAAEPVAWIERWYGSAPERGWSICEKTKWGGHGRVIAYLGGDESISAAVHALVAAHNQIAHPPAAPSSQDDVEPLCSMCDGDGTVETGEGHTQRCDCQDGPSQDAAERADVRGLVEEIGCRLRQSGLLKDNRLAERLEAALSPTGEAQGGEG